MYEPDPQFLRQMAVHARSVERLLDDALSDVRRDGELARPPALMAAMRHGVLNGGKRLRPFLVLESAALFAGHDAQAALRVAAALECIHCYSLIHDDLPAMDDDDLRRGKPTVHIAYGEALAILAGDALQTLAFELIAAPETPLAGDRKAELVLALSRAAGLGGMVGGQILDIAAEAETPDEAGIALLQSMKTGALLRFAVEAGAIIAGASADDRKRLRAFGETIGLAFQLADDLLDVTASTEAMGKATAKDAARGKATFVSIHGETWVRNRLAELTEEARAHLAPFAQAGESLAHAADFIVNRSS